MCECQCCFERFTKVRRTPFGCPNTECKYSVCKDCAKTFLREQVSPKCMACDTFLPREFLREKLGLKWLTHDLYASQVANLFATEKARFGQDMEEALRIKEDRKRYAEAKELRSKWSALIKKQASLLNEKQVNATNRIDKSILASELLAIKLQINEIASKIEIIDREDEISMLLSNQNDNKFEYKIRCPKEECVGFANDLGRCTHCQTFICETCHEAANEGHICNPDTIKNVQLLQKDTKGCPKCDTPIHKTEGCDQMWCPQCKTAFSWNTGKIEKGIIHNPHYYQWQQAQEQGVRNVGDQACGGIPTRQTINQLVRSFTVLLDGVPKKAIETKARLLVIRSITLGHFVLLNTIQDDLDNHRGEIQQREEILRKMRIKVLIGEIKDECEYKNKHLNNFLHQQSYALEAIPIYEMATVCTIERLNEIIGHLSYENVAKLREELSPRTVGDLVLILLERIDKIHSELDSIYKYVAQELVKLTSHYPKKIKNRGLDIASLFERLYVHSKECEKIVMDGYGDLDDAWTNPITDRFGEV